MTDKAQMELKPCPFCGGKPILDLHYEDMSINEATDADLEMVVVRCSSCGYSKQRSEIEPIVTWWNTRASLTKDGDRS